MTATHEALAGFGKADHCDAYRRHRPTPLRFIWHHILPQTCGGHTELDNLASLCDSCHYSVHALLYQLKQHGAALKLTQGTKAQRALALRGYAAAVAAGTVDKIPDEGA